MTGVRLPAMQTKMGEGTLFLLNLNGRIRKRSHRLRWRFVSIPEVLCIRRLWYLYTCIVPWHHHVHRGSNLLESLDPISLKNRDRITFLLRLYSFVTGPRYCIGTSPEIPLQFLVLVPIPADGCRVQGLTIFLWVASTLYSHLNLTGCGDSKDSMTGSTYNGTYITLEIPIPWDTIFP
jgi:hypothetical protein